MSGYLYVVTAPSGAGKTTLVHLLCERDADVHRSISYTTRSPRANEENGREYCFTDVPHFLRMIEAGELVEWAEVHGHYYGTSRIRIEDALDKGHDVLLEIDWQGAQQIRRLFPETISIFILPPSMAELEKRLAGRGTDTAAVIARRMAAARDEMRHVSEFDYVIINTNLQQALAELQSVVCASRLRYTSQRKCHTALFNDLLFLTDR